ncbi:DUF4038 domain-containing protein [Telluribacter sp. SYSU D00476]|uniref:apiosidase-like domain-containing protein n=1 Tax=Telluribacter sp. SYSU D00476 TaxID=2811430 RepID=UPI001FF59933|nr:DUF4038 domain-containing protein [Telluribacter sp. SYSU D00476]
MKESIRSLIAGLLLVIVVCSSVIGANTEAPAPYQFPLKVAASHTYLVDKTNRAFLLMGDVCLPLLSKLSYDETITYLDTRKSQSFNTVLLNLLPDQAVGTLKNGKAPFLTNDLSKPNPAYYDYIYKVVQAALSRNILVGLVVNWPEGSSSTSAPSAYQKLGEYLGKRFATSTNVVWIVDENSRNRNNREFALALKKLAPRHLVAATMPTITGGTGEVTADQTWLDFGLINSYFASQKGTAIRPEVPSTEVPSTEVPYSYLVARHESLKADRKPFVMAELSTDTSAVAPRVLSRQQAYWSLMEGGMGYCYRSQVSNFPRNWKNRLKEEGVTNMTRITTIVKGFPWYLMKADTSLSFLVNGQTVWGDSSYITCNYLPNHRMAVMYIPASRELEVDLTQLEGEYFRAVWYSPRTGKRWLGGHYPTGTNQKIAPPAEQPEWDWILLIGNAPK